MKTTVALDIHICTNVYVYIEREREIVDLWSNMHVSVFEFDVHRHDHIHHFRTNLVFENYWQSLALKIDHITNTYVQYLYVIIMYNQQSFKSNVKIILQLKYNY